MAFSYHKVGACVDFWLAGFCLYVAYKPPWDFSSGLVMGLALLMYLDGKKAWSESRE